MVNKVILFIAQNILYVFLLSFLIIMGYAVIFRDSYPNGFPLIYYCVYFLLLGVFIGLQLMRIIIKYLQNNRKKLNR